MRSIFVSTRFRARAKRLYTITKTRAWNMTEVLEVCPLIHVIVGS
jgi:hypothetical protein